MNERRVKGPYGLFLSHHSHNRSVRTLHTHVRRSIRSVPSRAIIFPVSLASSSRNDMKGTDRVGRCE